MKHLLLSLIILASASSFASAQLAWQRKQVDLKARPSDAAAVVSYPFTNTGPRTVTLKEIKLACDCSSAEADKTTIPPGASGKVTMTFEFGTRLGLEKKTARVVTDDPASDAELVLNVEIPQTVRVSPQFVYWTPADLATPKDVEFIVVTDEPAHVTAVKSTNPAVKAQLKTVSEGKHYVVTLSVDPAAGAKPPVEAMVSIETDFPRDKPRTHQVFVRVTSSRRNRSSPAPGTPAPGTPAPGKSGTPAGPSATPGASR